MDLVVIIGIPLLFFLLMIVIPEVIIIIKRRGDQKHQLMMARELRQIAGDGTDLVKAIMLDKELARQIADGLQTALERSDPNAPKQLSVKDELDPLPDPDQDTDLAHAPVQRPAQTT